MLQFLCYFINTLSGKVQNELSLEASQSEVRLSELSVSFIDSFACGTVR